MKVYSMYIFISPTKEILRRGSQLPARSLSKEFVIASPVGLGRLAQTERERGLKSQLQWRLILKDLSAELVDMTELERRENEYNSL